MTKRHWASWWSGYYQSEGCTKPPYTTWVSGERDRTNDDTKSDFSFCAVMVAHSADQCEAAIKRHYPDYEMRFCNEVADDFMPGSRFPGEFVTNIEDQQ